MEWSSVKKKETEWLNSGFTRNLQLKKPKNKKTKQQDKTNKKEIQLTKYKEWNKNLILIHV